MSVIFGGCVHITVQKVFGKFISNVCRPHQVRASSLRYYQHFSCKDRNGCFLPFSSNINQKLISSKGMEGPRQNILYAKEIFLESVNSVLPRPMLERVLHYSPDDSTLEIDGCQYLLKQNLFVVGSGKAVCGMARVIDDVLREHIVNGIVSIPFGSREALKAANKVDMLLRPDSRIKIFEGARNNLPDEDAHAAAMAIKNLASSLTQTDILIVLISGGGSALLPSPWPPITISEEMELTTLLSQQGAAIQELNTVRKNIEILKGGGLAKVASPAKVVSLILSDVIGDPLDIIASGPTVPDSSNSGQCFELFRQLAVTEQVPPSVIQHLEMRRLGEANLSNWDSVQNVIVGSNTIALSAAALKAESLGYLPYILSVSLDGEAVKVAKMFIRLADFIWHIASRSPDHGLTNLKLDLVEAGVAEGKVEEIFNLVKKSQTMRKGLCIISGGETVVNVKGSGHGGRNLEMVLAAAIHLQDLARRCGDGRPKFCFLSAGTDGQDGPTDAAGAVIDANFLLQAHDEGLDPEDYLKNNDSYTFFNQVSQGMSLIKTGLTGTNVMDIQILMVAY